MTDLQVHLHELSQRKARELYADVERRLLAGENRVTILGPPMTVYEVPRWREQPLRRLRLEIARRRGPR